MAKKSSDACPHLTFSAWQPRYLQETVYNNLVAVICVNITSAVICIVLNALVVLVVVTKQQLRTVYNILLACLAVTDVLVGLLLQPLTVAAEIKHIFGLGPFCMFDTVLGVVGIGLCLASVGHLMLISVERYISIKFPLRYDDIVTEKRLLTGVVTVWLVSAVGIIAMIFLASINTESDLYSILLVASDLMFIVVIAVYIVIIVSTHTAVFLEAKKHKRRLQTEQLPDEEAKRLKKNHKAAKTLTIILTALFFSYLPVTVLFGSATFLDGLVEPHMLYVLSTWSYTFAFLCSLLNPLIYCWRLEKLRGALFDILHLRRAQDSLDVELQTQRNNHRPHPSDAWPVAPTG